MSRLLDKFTKLKKTTSQPMGFRASHGDTKEPDMVVIASLPVGAADNAKDYTAGADAVYLKAEGASLTANSVGDIIKSITEIPCGISIADIGKSKVNSYLQAGCDFMVLPMESPVTLLPDEEDVGKLIQIDLSIDDSLARAVNNLPINAVMTTELSGKAETITLKELMIIQRIALLISKPVIIPVSPGISAEELKLVRDAGVEGIMVVVNTKAPDRVKEISEAIRNLPPTATRKYDKSDVLLPRGSSTEPLIQEEEDDYE